MLFRPIYIFLSFVIIIAGALISGALRNNVWSLFSSFIPMNTRSIPTTESPKTTHETPECWSGYTKESCKNGTPDSLCNSGNPSSPTYTKKTGIWNWTCSNNDQTVSCSVADESKCVIISVEGYNPDGTFHSVVDKIAQKYQCPQYKKIVRERIESKKNDGDELIKKLDTTITSYNNNNDTREKILVAAHSLGAVAAYSVKINSGPTTDTSYLFYDPPYNYPCVGLSVLCPSFLLKFLSDYTSINIKNGKLIRDMNNRWLNAETPWLTDWSNGLDGKQNTNSTLPDDVLHMTFLNNPQSLSDIDRWINTNCKT